MKISVFILCQSLANILLFFSWIIVSSNALVLPNAKTVVFLPRVGLSNARDSTRLYFRDQDDHHAAASNWRSTCWKIKGNLAGRSDLNLGYIELSRSKTALLAKKDDKNDGDYENKLAEMREAYNARMDAFMEQLKEAVAKFQQKFQLPSSFTDNLPDWLSDIRSKLKLGFLSFLAGIVFTFVAILAPVYNEVESLTEPVTLFETILNDLERGYVEEVDTNKLFETGVSAMLRSLDPYTEFEGKQEASDLTESITGTYGGVGLVISGSLPQKSPKTTTAPEAQDTMLQQQEQQPPEVKDALKGGDVSSVVSPVGDVEDPDDDGDMDLDDMNDLEELQYRKRQVKVARDRGIHVISAFEGYAFDYGMRVGDKLVGIDDTEITDDFSVEDVRNTLRGEPGTLVTISFTREGVDGVQSVTMPRTVVRVRDVKLATLLGDSKDGIGYIQLSGFASNTGAEMRGAILALQQAALEASQGKQPLRGLVLDLRGNPGGLLTSAVDVASLLVPKGSDIVSARGRGFPGVVYRSRVDPIIDYSQTKLAVLINDRTASAAEIVSGAVQDLDCGVIVGADRTFGKGLVQNVEDLPFDTALKFTVAKYYTPSGRCIQGIQYREGGGLDVENGRYKEKKVAEKDRNVYYTQKGRRVQDGGGIEADYKVQAPTASALEVTLLRSNLIADYAAQWSRTHQLTKNFEVDDRTYRDFQKFVTQKQQKGDIKLEALYNGPINDLKKILKQSGYKGSEKELARLKEKIVQEVTKDFDHYKNDIKEDISQSILARYLPESMLIERGVKSDVQVKAAVKLLKNGRGFDRLLAKGSASDPSSDKSLNIASSSVKGQPKDGAKLNAKW